MQNDSVSRDNQKLLLDLLNLLEKIDDTHRPIGIFLDHRMDLFRGANKKQSMYELFSIDRRISPMKIWARLRLAPSGADLAHTTR